MRCVFKENNDVECCGTLLDRRGDMATVQRAIIGSTHTVPTELLLEISESDYYKRIADEFKENVRTGKLFGTVTNGKISYYLVVKETDGRLVIRHQGYTPYVDKYFKLGGSFKKELVDACINSYNRWRASGILEETF